MLLSVVSGFHDGGEAVERLPELQAAVRALAGVAWAAVVWPDPHGPATLHVAFEGGADAERVARSVLATMGEVAGVGVEGLHLQVAVEEPPGREPVEHRPLLADVSTDTEGAGGAVSVTLAQEGRVSTATAGAPGEASLEVAVTATLQALQGLLGRHPRARLDWVAAVQAPSAGQPEVVHVGITVHTSGEPEQHVGAALVRGDRLEAAARATLDALTRRLQRPEPPEQGAAGSS